jgi:hypothetical protein
MDDYYHAFHSMHPTFSIFRDDDAPTGPITYTFIQGSPTSSGNDEHESGSSQSSLAKAFQEAFFATRSRVLKVSGVCGITSLTLFYPEPFFYLQLYNLPPMADSFLYQLFFPHNVRLHVILLLNIKY